MVYETMAEFASHKRILSGIPLMLVSGAIGFGLGYFCAWIDKIQGNPKGKEKQDGEE